MPTQEYLINKVTPPVTEYLKYLQAYPSLEI
jgi:hypothetical protein